MSIFEPDRENTNSEHDFALELEILTDSKWFTPYPDEIEDRWDDAEGRS